MLKLIELFTADNSNISRHLMSLLQKLSKEEVKRVLYYIENSTYILPIRFRPESRHMS